MLEERHEIIEFAKKVPLKLFIHNLGDVTKHWHKSLELLMVLSGSVAITVEDMTHTLVHGDVILINSNQMHELHSQSGVMLAAQINRSLLDESNIPADEFNFYCNSVADTQPQKYANLKRTIASIVKSNANPSESQDYINIAFAYQLFSQLIDDFRVSGSGIRKSSPKLQRLTQIIDYIDSNYAQDISLTCVAEKIQLSAPYLSAFFEKNMGMTFSAYCAQTKLAHAVEDLLATTESIEAVAARNGFPEAHAFVRVFKRKYGQLPSVYRKNAGQPSSLDNNRINYLNIKPGSILYLLAEYLPENSGTMVPAELSAETIFCGTPVIEVSHSQTTLRHTFRKIIGVAKAKDLLLSSVQSMLKDLQRTVGFEFIKFHGLLGDDMLVCRRQDSELLFRFNLIDEVIDFLLTINLKPMIQLSFMPEDLAKYKSKTVYANRFIVSEPEDINEWNALTVTLTTHLIERYGRDEVSGWPFSVWNEPDTSPKLFGFYRDQDFYNFYKSTYDTVKSVEPQIKFGSPAVLPVEAINRDWLKNFLAWTQANSCCPDYLDVHYYSDIFHAQSENFQLSSLLQSSELSKDESQYKKFVIEVKALQARLGLDDLPVYLTEWGLTVSHRNLMNDTCFKACYTMKNLLENYDALDSFGYWSLTDMIEENVLPDKLFHGGMGLYTANGIRKGVFHVFDFVSRLGSSLLYSGTNCFVTRKGASVIMIVYNYEHFNNLFADGEMFDMTPLKRYTPFNKSAPLQIAIPLIGLDNGTYNIREYFVNQEVGSAFDQWVKMGGLPIGQQEKIYLEAAAMPAFRQNQVTTDNGRLSYEAMLEPLEIRLVEITRNFT